MKSHHPTSDCRSVVGKPQHHPTHRPAFSHRGYTTHINNPTVPPTFYSLCQSADIYNDNLIHGLLSFCESVPLFYASQQASFTIPESDTAIDDQSRKSPAWHEQRSSYSIYLLDQLVCGELLGSSLTQEKACPKTISCGHYSSFCQKLSGVTNVFRVQHRSFS